MRTNGNEDVKEHLEMTIVISVVLKMAMLMTSQSYNVAPTIDAVRAHKLLNLLPKPVQVCEPNEQLRVIVILLWILVPPGILLQDNDHG